MGASCRFWLHRSRHLPVFFCERRKEGPFSNLMICDILFLVLVGSGLSSSFMMVYDVETFFWFLLVGETGCKVCNEEKEL